MSLSFQPQGGGPAAEAKPEDIHSSDHHRSYIYGKAPCDARTNTKQDIPRRCSRKAIVFTRRGVCALLMYGAQL